MNVLDIIDKKRKGEVLSKQELETAFLGYLKGKIPDYQMSSLLMAICIQGMKDEEIFDLTDIFIASGEILDLSGIHGVTVDKHSTGGIGDKTTLVVGPIVASLGLKVPKMSGRGLGYTGGTIDKLESIPGFRVNLGKEEFLKQVDEVGFAVTSQTANLAPLDKKIYALRDVTGTVESIPLIASSIMSKKIACGASNIVIDVKVGSGALLKTKEEALEISRLMKEIGKRYHRTVETMITYMDIPLGIAIGNALEIMEVIKILKNEEDNYLVALCKSTAAKMVSMGKNIGMQEALYLVEDVLKTGKAYQKFEEMVKAQGGDLTRLPFSQNVQKVLSTKKGHIIHMDARKFGKLSLDLGGGRVQIEDRVDSSVGIVLNKKIGDDVQVGDLLCTLYLKEGSAPIPEDITNYYTFQEDEIL